MAEMQLREESHFHRDSNSFILASFEIPFTGSRT